MQITEVNRKNNSNEDTVDICENNFPPEFEAGATVAIAWPNVFIDWCGVVRGNGQRRQKNIN